jgi:small conductance mechanosensitive channel
MRPLFFLQEDVVATEANNVVETSTEVVTEPTAAESIDTLLNYDFNTIKDILVDGILTIGWKIIVALAIFYVGRWVIRRILKLLDKIYERKSVDLAIRGFLSGIVNVLLYIAVVLMIVQTIGVDTTSLVAMLASAGLAIGMALSGTLQNFAGGVMLIVLKPYRIGDYIEAQGEEGTVKRIGLFTTEIHTVDNRVINIPNGSISTSVIENYSTADMRRLDWSVRVEYGTEPDNVRKVLLDIAHSDNRVTKETAPVVFLTELSDSAVVFSLRVWVKNCDYWDVKFNIQEKIYTELPKNGISFPYPQLDVTIKK